MANQITMFGVDPIESADSNEWYTPGDILQAARDLLLCIDLDPASCTQANQEVKARRYYTKQQNGLSLPWEGKVWLNPPYANGLIQAFVNKLLEQLQTGNTTEALMLVNNATDTTWFHRLVNSHCFVSACFLQGRLKFWGPVPSNQTPRNGQVVLYFQSLPVSKANWELQSKFIETFQHFGWCI